MVKNPIIDYINSIVYKKTYLYVVGVSIFMVIVTVLINPLLPPQVPILYGLPQTHDQLVPSYLVGLPIFSAMIISIFNFMISPKFKDIYSKKVLLVVSILCLVLAIVASFKVIFLVGSFNI